MRNYLMLFLVAGLVAGMFLLASAKAVGKTPVPARTPGGLISVYYGVITALSPQSLTLKPQAPKRQAHGIKLHKSGVAQLPSSVTVQLEKSTRWYFKDAAGSAKDFAVGDTIRIKLRRRADGRQDPIALWISDPQSAFRFLTGTGSAASGRKRARQELLPGKSAAARRPAPKAPSVNKKPSDTSRKGSAAKAQPGSSSYQRQSSAGLLILARKNRNKPDQSGINGTNNSLPGSDTPKKHKNHRLFKKRHRKHHTATYGS